MHGGEVSLSGRPFVLVPLKGGRAVFRPYPSYSIMRPTCGTIEVSGRRAPINLINGLPIPVRGASGAEGNIVACSDDLSWAYATFAVAPVKAEIPAIGTNILYLLGGPKLSAVSQGIMNFAVSPAGRYLMFETLSTNQVCTVSLDSLVASCTADATSYDGSITSVSDRGGILANWDGDASCGFEGAVGVWEDGHAKPYPGAYRDGGPCPEVFFWRPPMRSARPVQPMGDEAQWITPAAAESLIAGYAAHRWPEF